MAENTVLSSSVLLVHFVPYIIYFIKCFIQDTTIQFRAENCVVLHKFPPLLLQSSTIPPSCHRCHIIFKCPTHVCNRQRVIVFTGCQQAFSCQRTWLDNGWFQYGGFCVSAARSLEDRKTSYISPQRLTLSHRMKCLGWDTSCCIQSVMQFIKANRIPRVLQSFSWPTPEVSRAAKLHAHYRESNICHRKTSAQAVQTEHATKAQSHSPCRQG